MYATTWVAGGVTFARAATAAIAVAAWSCSTSSTGPAWPRVRQLADQAESTFASAVITTKAPTRSAIATMMRRSAEATGSDTFYGRGARVVGGPRIAPWQPDRAGEPSGRAA